MNTTFEQIKLWLLAYSIARGITSNPNISKGVATTTIESYRIETDKGIIIEKPYGWTKVVARNEALKYVKYLAIFGDTTIDETLELLGSTNHLKESEQIEVDFQKSVMQEFTEQVVELFNGYDAQKRDVLYLHFKGQKSHDIEKMLSGITAANARQIKRRFVTAMNEFTPLYEKQISMKLMQEKFVMILDCFYALIEGRKPPRNNFGFNF